MRVSERMRYDLVKNRVEDSKGQNAKSLDRLSSQKDVVKLSDDPVKAMQIVRFRDQILNLRQYQKNIDYSKGFIERTESAVQGLADNLIRAKELAVAMANDTYDANSRDATGREVREIIDEVVQLGNTSYNGRYVFGGFRNMTPPLSPGGEYLGDDGAIYLQVSRGNFRQINLQARNLFDATPENQEAGHFSMVHALEVLHKGLMNDDKDMIRKAMDELSHQTEKATSYQATVGAIHKALSDTNVRLEREEVASRENLSKVQDADIYDATSEFKRTEAVLQGTLMASTKLLQPSLLNFMQ